MRSQMKNYLMVIACLFVLFSTVHAAMPVDTSDYLIAGSHDGNLHDHDDYLATALGLGLLGEAGMQGKVLHWDYSNHLGINDSTMNNNMIISTEDGADKFGFSPAGRFNDDAFFNCQNELSAGIANFVAVSELLGPDLYLYYCCAGPMEVPWRMLNAVKNNNASKLNYIVCISHSNWNETHTHGTQLNHTWNDMVDDFGGIGVAFHRIVDQNSCGGTNDFNSPESKWNWLCSSGIPEWEWICTRDDKVDFDASDAGMYMYVISGEAQTGKDTHRGGPRTGANRYNGDSCASVQDCQWLFEEYDPITDNDPPTPNPAQWQTPPHAVDDNTITMTAEAGTDTDSPPVEYYFTVTSGDCLSADSGWQTDPTYTLGGLAAGRQYCFTVKMQDQSGNETTPSEELCTTTTGVLDIVPPSPAPDFELAPVAVNSNEITMLATLTTDDNGPVEYYFTETSGNPGGSDSGWQTSREYTDTGLSGGHDYTYTVTARDAVCNETAASGPESAFTPIPQVTELTFAPTNDAYLQGTTLYNNTQLKVEPDYRVSYLMFDVTGIPANYDVTGATITLTENGDTGTGTLNFYLGSHNDWTETTLSSGTAPSTSVLVGVRSGAVSGGQTITVNVDSLVTGNGIVTLIIQMETGGNDIWFGSKESGAAGPVLTVTAESSGPAGYCGDLTLDGKVNLDDFAALSAGWPSVYTLADLFHVANDWLAGTAPYSLWFDGLDDYMEIPGYNGISGSQPRTVSAWVKTNPLATNQTIIQWGTDATGQLWLFYILSDGKLALAGYGGGVMSNAVVADGQWHHVAAVLEDGQNTSDAVKLYVDRQLDAVPFAGVCTLNTTADQPLHIGVWNRPVAADKIFYFLGHIDDVRIYDRALSAVEIGSIATTEDGLVAHWDLNEGSGDIARDYVSGYTGTIYGAQWVPE